MRRPLDPDEARKWDDARADDFRCLGCEANIGRRGYCWQCRKEMGEDA